MRNGLLSSVAALLLVASAALPLAERVHAQRFSRRLELGSVLGLRVVETNEAGESTVSRANIRVIANERLGDDERRIEWRFERNFRGAFEPSVRIPGGLPAQIVLSGDGVRLPDHRALVLGNGARPAPANPPLDTIYMFSQSGSLGCFAYAHAPASDARFEWRLCFDRDRVPMEYSYTSAHGRLAMTFRGHFVELHSDPATTY